MKVLKWIFCIPIALLVAVLTNHLIIAINTYTFRYYSGLDPNNILFFVWLTFTSYIFPGAIFVMVGSYIAPDKKKNFSVVLSVILGIISGIALFPAIVNSRFWEITGILFANVGSILFTVEKHKQPNENWPFEF